MDTAAKLIDINISCFSVVLQCKYGSMCGKFCAIRSMNKALEGENIDIL